MSDDEKTSPLHSSPHFKKKGNKDVKKGGQMKGSTRNGSLKYTLLLLSTSLISAGPWPGPLPGIEISSGLPAGYEPSGAVWHTQLHKFFTVWDNGVVSMMDYDGMNVVSWNVGGDLEGICIPDPNSNFVFVGVEGPLDGVKEFNYLTGQVTRFFDLTPWMHSIDPNLGLEALTFVPDTTNSEGGYFYAGLQETGTIYIFELPILSSSTDTTATLIDSIQTGFTLISGLDYNTDCGLLYALWRFLPRLRVISLDGNILAEWNLPGSCQEGVALWDGLTPGQAQIFIAEDNGGVWRYDFNSACNITIVGGGSVNLAPDPPTFYGTTDTLTAIPDTGHQFLQWSGDLTGSANPTVLLMDYDKNVTATFEYLGIVQDLSDKHPHVDQYLGATVFSGPWRLPEGTTCRVYGIMGNLVDPADIKSGIYFVEIDGQVVQKLVKIK